MDNIRKIFIFVIILSILGGGFVFWTHQVNANVMYFLKEFVIKPLIRTLANALENKIVNALIAKISGVKQGQPNFITNWRNQILDSQGRGNDVFRSVLADTKLCPYLDKNIKQSFGADKYVGALAGATVKNSQGQVVYQNKTTTPGQPSFQQIANCTLGVGVDIGKFQKNFNQGGWAVWDELIKPQNNFFGSYSLALAEQARQISTDSQASQNQSIAGQGYKGSKLGTSGAGTNGCVGAGGVNRCIFEGKFVTPPKVIADIQSTALGSKISRAGFGTELTDVIQGLIGSVMTGLLSGITNLAGQHGYNIAPIVDSLNNELHNAFDESQSKAQTPEANPDTPANLQSGNVCKQGCESDNQSCLTNVSIVCVDTGKIDPETGKLEQDCHKNPDQVAECNNNLNTCQNQCSYSQ